MLIADCRKIGGWLPFAVLACGISLAAQGVIGGVSGGQVAATRERPAAQTGTGAIKGRVTDLTSGGAVAGARVMLIGPGGPPRTMVSDARGGFAFSSLPAGNYTINVNKPGYINGAFPSRGET